MQLIELAYLSAEIERIVSEVCKQFNAHHMGVHRMAISIVSALISKSVRTVLNYTHA